MNHLAAYSTFSIANDFDAQALAQRQSTQFGRHRLGVPRAENVDAVQGFGRRRPRRLRSIYLMGFLNVRADKLCNAGKVHSTRPSTPGQSWQ
jgi:hypothetical protein